MAMHSQFVTEKLVSLLNESVIPYNINEDISCKKVADLVGDARIVLMGEASHGTLEFYQARMALSQYLIKNKGFQAIAVEGDWTSVYSIHRYCQGYDNADKPQAALDSFNRFPTWMWKNTEMLKFILQLRQYNEQFISNANKIGFYGLDLYCLSEAAHAVIDYLHKKSPEAAKIATERYACFDHAKTDSQLYSYLIENKLKQSCLKEVTTQLLEVYRLAYQNLKINSNLDVKEEQFCMTQNARVVKNAEHYYRSLFEPHHITWNIRDQHMVETLQNIMSHLETSTNQPAKIIIWAHNSHLGDARVTEMSDRQEVNLGQLVRERFNTNSFSLGFSTAEGVVTAASDWGAHAEYKQVQPPLKGSYEWLFHQLNEKNFLLDLREENPLTHLLSVPQLQRAIGVIYRPETERMSHYYLSCLPYQFDAMIHFDKTHALPPLDHREEVRVTELSDTYPEGF